MGLFDNVGNAIFGAGLLNVGSSALTNMANLKLANKQNMWNWQQLQYMNNYNSPLQQIQRLKQAGLNPNLVYGSGNVVGNQSGSLTSVPMSVKDVRFGDILKGAAEGYMTAKNMEVEYNQKLANVALTQQQKDTSKAQADLYKSSERLNNSKALGQDKYNSFADELYKYRNSYWQQHANKEASEAWLSNSKAVMENWKKDSLAQLLQERPDIIKLAQAASYDSQIYGAKKIKYEVEKLLPARLAQIHSQIALNSKQLDVMSSIIELNIAKIGNLAAQNKLYAANAALSESNIILNADRCSQIEQQIAHDIQRMIQEDKRFSGWTVEDTKKLGFEAFKVLGAVVKSFGESVGKVGGTAVAAAALK